jgi:hydroxyacylglutathione hydrolase
MKICDGIYSYVWRGVFVNNCNSFYFGEPFNTLYDPGLVNYLDQKYQDMKGDGIDTSSIQRIAFTHCHPDHFECAEKLQKEGKPLAMHETEIAFFNDQGPGFFRMFGMPFPSIEFDTVIKEGGWKIGDVELEVYHTPGHSPGSVCFYWREKKAMICGDLVFQQSVGRVDFPGGDGRKMKESIRKIMELDIEYLLPGHMDIIQGADKVRRNFEMIEKYFFSMM